MVTGIRVGLPLDERRLRAALDGTVRRHPALRASFHLTGYSEPLQLVHRDAPCRSWSTVGCGTRTPCRADA